MDNKRIDPFDDLFEPFDLEQGEDPTEEGEQRIPRTVPVRTDDAPSVTGDISGILCASCGALNHVGNRHCDTCGARLVRSQMPVAPQPMLRTTAGARALIVLSSVVLAVALLAFVFNIVGGSEDLAAPATTEAPPQVIDTQVVQLEPMRIECTSELPNHPCGALIDDNPATDWNAVDGGVNAEITVYFQPPVQITEIWLDNLEDEGRFLRNARIRSVEVSLNDNPSLYIRELGDTRDTQVLTPTSLRTTRVVIRITNAYPGIAYEGQEPFNELAVQGLTFWGRVAPGE